MKNSKKNFSEAGQSLTEKKPQKHDANLQKNSTLYFQIGLILSLLAVYGLFEMQFAQQNLIVNEDLSHIEDDLEPFTINPKVEQPKPKVLQQKDPAQEPKKAQLTEVNEVDNEFNEAETNVVDSEPTETAFTPVGIGEIDDEPKIEDEIVDFKIVEFVPIYPGCEKKKTNDARKKCMSTKISKLINRKFNGDIASEYGLSGKQRIYTQFTIDKNGNVTDIKTLSTHPALEKEAKRVIDKIPSMKPGYQRNTPVGVVYTLPISFHVQD